jgi:hypothetical protein
VVALRGGWIREKLAADGEVLAALPRLLRERREVQQLRTVSEAAFVRHMTADLSSPYLGAAGRSRWLQAVLRAYWRAVLALIGAS